VDRLFVKHGDEFDQSMADLGREGDSDSSMRKGISVSDVHVASATKEV